MGQNLCLCLCLENRKDSSLASETKKQIKISKYENRMTQNQNTSQIKEHATAPEEINENELPQEFQDWNQVLLVGKAGVGKTTLFMQIFSWQKKKYRFNHVFQQVVIEDSRYIVVDTPTFELDETIDKREETIKQFKDYISKYQQSISTLAIVVNFERTDLMKQKVQDVYKYLNKFKQMVIMIVLGWELNDNVDVTEEYMHNSFRLITKDIVFIKKEDKDVATKISRILRSKLEQPINLQGTMFEKINTQEFTGEIEKICLAKVNKSS